jgi:hypothetical protein
MLVLGAMYVMLVSSVFTKKILTNFSFKTNFDKNTNENKIK